MNEYNNKDYWIFYRISNSADIYAFTDNKEIAENFKKSRNMKKFYKKKVNLNNHEINDLINEYMTAELQIFSGLTKSSNNLHTAVNFTIPLTMRENQVVTAMSSLLKYEKILQYVWNNPYIFKNKYIKALDTIKYIYFHDSLFPNTYDIDDNDGIYADDFTIIMTEYRDLFIDIEGDKT